MIGQFRDLDKPLKLEKLENIFKSNLTSDIVSKNMAKEVIMLELTLPWKERLEEDIKIKRANTWSW